MRRAGDRHVVEGLGDRLRRRCRGRGRAGPGTRSITTAVASWSPDEQGSTVLSRPTAWSATSERGGQATTTRQPRRTASATAEAAPVSLPSGASTTTRSRRAGPAGQGRAGPGHERHRAPRLEHGPQQPGVRPGGDHGAGSRRRPSAPATAAAIASAAAPASRRTREPASASGRSAASAAASAASSSSRESSKTSAIVAYACLGAARLVDEQHRDVVADRVGQPARGADQLGGGLVDGQRPPAVRADDDLEQGGVEVHESLLMVARTSSRSRSSVAWSPASALSRSSGSVLDARTLNHQSGWLTRQPVEVVERDAVAAAVLPPRSPRPPRPGRRPWS